MSDEITIEVVNRKPAVRFRSCLIGDPQELAAILGKESAGIQQETARNLGKAFALLVASRLPPQNETNRRNLSKYADQYYVSLSSPDSNRAFDDGFNEAVDEMLHAVVARENHIEVLARKLGLSD